MVQRYKENSLQQVCEIFHNTFPNRPIPHTSSVLQMVRKFKAIGVYTRALLREWEKRESLLKKKVKKLQELWGRWYVVYSWDSTNCWCVQANKARRILIIPLSKPSSVIKKAWRHSKYVMWSIDGNNTDPNYLQGILFTDEVTFYLHGEVNWQNTSEDNLYQFYLSYLLVLECHQPLLTAISLHRHNNSK